MVRAPTGDVGDLSWADRSPAATSPPSPLALRDWDFLCWRWRRASSLCSLILIDRLAGAISSLDWEDRERVWRLGVASLGLAASESDSDDNPDDEEPDEMGGRMAGDVCWVRLCC